MTHQQKVMLGVLALLAALTETSTATVLNFAKNEFGSVPVNNEIYQFLSLVGRL